VRSGAAAAVFTSLAYSITVRDKRRVLVSSSLFVPDSITDISDELANSSTPETGAGMVGFQHTASGAAARNVRLKLLDGAVTPQDFDNGSRTDNQKIDFAIAAAKASGRHVNLGDFTYSLTAPVVISSASTLHIFSQGAINTGLIPLFFGCVGFEPVDQVSIKA
jgi:hypothetical protein